MSNAYMNQERALQINQKRLLAERELERLAQWEAQTKSKLATLDMLDEERQHRTAEQTLDYQNALEAQLEELEEKKRMDYVQFLREKAMVDEIVKKIREEDEREQELRMSKQKETKQFIEEYITQRQEWRKREEERIKLENQKIEEHAVLQARRYEEATSKKMTASNERGIIYDRLAAEMNRKESEKRELENLRLELYKEEEEESARLRDAETIQCRIRKRLELIQAYHDQIAEKRQKITREREDEEIYRARLLEQFAKDERIEQMNAQKRRMKQLEHKRTVEALIAERLQKIEQEAQIEREISERERMLQQYRDDVVEQERQRLLQEHAGPLAGYLPKGVFRDAKDLDLFDEEFKRKFSQGIL